MVADLAGKATTTALNNGLAGKEPTIAEGGLAQSKVAGLVAALNDKVSTASMNTALLYKQNLIGDNSLAISATSGLQTALDAKGPALSDLAGTGSSFIYDQAARHRSQNLRS